MRVCDVVAALHELVSGEAVKLYTKIFYSGAECNLSIIFMYVRLSFF